MIPIKTYTIAIICVLSFTTSFSQQNPEIRFEDKIRIKEAMQISEVYGDSIWTGFNKPPFTIILVTDDYEFLIHHPYPSDDFQLIGKDEVLKADIYYRQQQFNKGFLATFPAVNGVNCIVIGTPENTGLNSTQWILTLLHERFHQYQYTSPNYHQDALALGLSNGDKTGMWQLNYPFPYENPDVIKKYEQYTNCLVEALENRATKSWDEMFQTLVKVRNEFKEVISEDDYKYISFQWYQEGVARYTEYAFLELLRNYRPSKEILNLNDFVSYESFMKEFYEVHLENVTRLNIEKHKRITVYDVGFAESLILERQNTDWRTKYLIEKFDLEKLYK